VDYIVDLIGIDHVGFGGDNTIDHSEDTGGTKEQSLLYPAVVEEYDRRVGTDPKVRHAKGFKGIHEIQNVVDGLRKRGYKDSDISKFLGGNFLRIIKQVWR
jgi:membrane dipeptidase